MCVCAYKTLIKESKKQGEHREGIHLVFFCLGIIIQLSLDPY